ncbi:MAG: hypothetical protein Kow0013_19260 [Pararhodobacter sp.]
MDYETVSGDAFGRSLRGIGVNLLCRDVRGTAAFLHACFGLAVHRVSRDFAIVRHGDALFQLHSDDAYSGHPLLDLVPENPPRGGAVQFYLFGIDPDDAVTRAKAAGGTIIEEPADKPHGLREATILSPEGHAFSPAVNKA